MFSQCTCFSFTFFSSGTFQGAGIPCLNFPLPTESQEIVQAVPSARAWTCSGEASASLPGFLSLPRGAEVPRWPGWRHTGCCCCWLAPRVVAATGGPHEKTPAAESTRSPLDPLPLQQLIGLVNSNGTGGAR